MISDFIKSFNHKIMLFGVFIWKIIKVIFIIIGILLFPFRYISFYIIKRIEELDSFIQHVIWAVFNACVETIFVYVICKIFNFPLIIRFGYENDYTVSIAFALSIILSLIIAIVYIFREELVWDSNTDLIDKLDKKIENYKIDKNNKNTLVRPSSKPDEKDKLVRGSMK